MCWAYDNLPTHWDAHSWYPKLKIIFIQISQKSLCPTNLSIWVSFQVNPPKIYNIFCDCIEMWLSPPVNMTRREKINDNTKALWSYECHRGYREVVKSKEAHFHFKALTLKKFSNELMHTIVTIRSIDTDALNSRRPNVFKTYALDWIVQVSGSIWVQFVSFASSP